MQLRRLHWLKAGPVAQNRIHFKTRKKRGFPGFFSELPETRVLNFARNRKH